LKEESRLRNDWYKKGIGLEKEVRDLREEKETLMKVIEDLKNK
jgi:hypothetical protein